MEWSDSASYDGQWQLGYATGKGVFIDCLGNRYEGQFNLSMAHGTGTYTNTFGAIYDGEWKFDMQHGKGQEKWLNSGSTFKGHFVDGLRNGHGVWIHNNKKYEGIWKNNMMDGDGTMEWGYRPTSSVMSTSDGKSSKTANDFNRSVTSLEGGQPSVSNAVPSEDQGVYTGGWKQNKMHGFGVFKWATGRVYLGHWVADMKQGVGKLTFKGGNEYSGLFLNDKREGFGFYTWSDNRKFKGWWHENKQHGLGVYFGPDSVNPKFGVWQMGKRIKWLDETEQTLIRSGHLDYINMYAPEHLPTDDKDRNF